MSLGEGGWIGTIWQQGQELGKPKSPALLPAQTTAPTEVGTTLKTKREILKFLRVLHLFQGQGWEVVGEWANVYTPKQNKSLNCCREDEHQGCTAEKGASGTEQAGAIGGYEEAMR